MSSQDRNDDEVMGRVSTTNYVDKTCFSIKTDVLTPVVNYLFYNRPTVCLSFERGFSYRHAFQLTGQYGTFSQKDYDMSWEWLKWKTDLYQTRTELILDYKYYWKDSNDFKGFYCGLYIRGIEYFSKFVTPGSAAAMEHVALRYIGCGGGATIGYQTFINDRITFDFLFGLGIRNVYFNPILNYPKEFIPIPLQTPYGIDIRTTINIGYKF